MRQRFFVRMNKNANIDWRGDMIWVVSFFGCLWFSLSRFRSLYLVHFDYVTVMSNKSFMKCISNAFVRETFSLSLSLCSEWLVYKCCCSALNFSFSISPRIVFMPYCSCLMLGTKFRVFLLCLVNIFHCELIECDPKLFVQSEAKKYAVMLSQIS